MKVELVQDSKVLGKLTPKWAILHDGRYVCGDRTQVGALRRYVEPNTLGTIQNYMRLNQTRKAAQMLRG